MITKIKKQLNKLDVHTLEVVKKSSSATVVKVLGMIAGLLVSVTLGRILGSKGLGIINLANKIVSILIILSLIGMPQLLIKEIAIAYKKKDWQHISNCLNSAFKLNGAIALGLSVLLIILTPWLCEHVFHEPDLKIPLIIAVSVMTPQVFSRIYSSGLVGFRKIWQSNLVNESLSIAIAGITLVVFWSLNISITVITAAIAYGIGRVLVTLTVSIYWGKLFRQFKTKSVNVSGKLAKSAWPFLMVSATGIIAANLDAVMIGWLGDVKEVGLYTVAARIAMLTIFFLQVSNSAISPKLAALYAEGKIQEMNKMVQRVTGGLIVVAAVPLVIFFLFGGQILSFWGAEFKEAYWVLIILSVGQFFNIGTGASGLVLVMCGFEKLHAYITIGSVVCNLIICYILIPLFGAVGAAIGMTVSIAIENVIKVVFAKKRTGVMTLPSL